jgi:hypothetical protein
MSGQPPLIDLTRIAFPDVEAQAAAQAKGYGPLPRS